ncbi:uncharacterized protein LOC18443399 [Amborella trichopoda]|uniref:uncharacterized protein LOC18443399 n=1 Tax=Amborella trichopoda TaxID=13333 RepID=UPI0005D2DB87|nr:uncharacterized protein LOC18443399 [Amborella trichopoda]|eukprot:XP_011626729.1 uncharacterized protein LOC18443399 [Amborella trichopoda]
MAIESCSMELTSGASGRIIPVCKNIKDSVLSWRALNRLVLVFYSLFLWIFLLLQYRRRKAENLSSSPLSSKSGSGFRRKGVFREQEDTLKRRYLAESLMVGGNGDGEGFFFEENASLFVNSRRNALFYRSWTPLPASELKGILILIHGLNEHSGRYGHFATQLTACNFGVYALDWIGHGGSDGLHGYVPSLDHVVADTSAFLEKVRLENPGIPCFLFGHSTGGAVVLKAASYPAIEAMLEGIVLTSPALRVNPAHPIVKALAPVFSLIHPTLQFKGANKRGIPVSRDPAALVAKYTDPLVYTGPIRVRTGHEILRICNYLQRNMAAITVPFLVLHGTADKVTDPLASQDLYKFASSKHKDIKLYEGFLHDLLFEPERDEIARDIMDWLEMRLESK